MTASQVIEKDVLIATMLAQEDPDNPGTYPFKDTFLMAGTANQYKIFWEHVQDDVELPYVVVSHIMGGRALGTTTSQSYSDTVWKIAVHSGDMSKAGTYSNIVALLQDSCPVTVGHAGVTPVNTIQETMPVFDRYQIQNVPMFVIGGLYRLMLNLGDN